VSISLSVYVSTSALAGSWFALQGTNAQAALAKEKLLTDSNPIVQAAARLWTPGRRWIIHRRRQRLQNVFEKQLQEQQPAEWPSGSRNGILETSAEDAGRDCGGSPVRS
jgi:hypothetical protein